MVDVCSRYFNLLRSDFRVENGSFNGNKAEQKVDLGNIEGILSFFPNLFDSLRWSHFAKLNQGESHESWSSSKTCIAMNCDFFDRIQIFFFRCAESS